MADARSPDTVTSAAPAPVLAPTLRIYLLGGFRLHGGAATIPDGVWRLRKARSLVKLLALAPAQALPREAVMDALWPDLDPAAADNNLRGALHAARRALAPHGAIASRGGALALRTPDGDAPWIDAADFEAAAATARRAGDVASYRGALDLYGGELLPEDRYEDWTASRRDFLRGLHLDLLRELAALHERAGDWMAAVAALRQLLAADPLHEEGHVALMRALALAGQRAQALAQWDQLVATLRSELDAEPDESARILHNEIVAGRFPSAGERATQVGANRPPPNLPASPTPLLGREAGVAAAVARLRDPGVRLLTLTGLGGVGKSRLALAVAEALLPDFPDGVYFVPLAALDDPALVPAAVARPLGIAEHGARPLRDTLRDALRERRLLLLLDNMEHLLPATDFVGELLAACPDLKILVTSRSALRLRWEHEEPVAPLTLPDAVLDDPAALASVPAVALFAARAAAVRPDFRLAPHNAAAVAAICRRLDGLPLALELAAARLALLSPAGLLQRLERALPLLTGGRGDRPERQQTLRAALAWSCDLLSPGEQAVFRRLAPFAGGCTLAAAEAVCGVDEPLAAEMLDWLGALIDHSLLRRDPARDDEARFAMLETVREFAAERLAASGEEVGVRRRHAEYFLALAEEAALALSGPAPQAALDRLEREHDNLRAALAWLLAWTDGGETALRLAGTLWRFWLMRGYASQGRDWLERALAAPGAEAPDARARALGGASALAHSQGDYARAAAHGEEGLRLYRDLADRAGIAGALGMLALARRGQGDYAAAIALAEEALALWRAQGDRQRIGAVLTNLSALANDLGDYARAEGYLTESLALKRELGDIQGIAIALHNLAECTRYQGDNARAAALLAESLALFRELGGPPRIAHALHSLGMVEFARADMARSAALLAESLDLFLALGERSGAILCLEGLAQLADARGDHTLAARLLGCVEAQRTALGFARAPVDRAAFDAVLERARAALGPPAFAAAWAVGRGLTLAEAANVAR